jgi:CubicO group peptidase (beta-lactamase class C family)
MRPPCAGILLAACAAAGAAAVPHQQHSNSSSGAQPPSRRQQDWGAVAAAIDAFALVPNCHVVIGNASGELFSYQKGNVGLDTQMSLFSATKWVSGVTAMAMVEAGLLSLDDLASAHLPYWTTDPEDARSRVTLRHLLGFVSGFSGGGSCAGLDTAACTQVRYETASHSAEPGERYAYNEVHINMASGVAVAASGGVPFAELVQRYVFDQVPGGMPSTRFTNTLNPAAGAGITSTPRDYAAFLRAYFTHGLVSEAGRIEMETDQYPLAQRSASDGGWHYGATVTVFLTRALAHPPPWHAELNGAGVCVRMQGLRIGMSALRMYQSGGNAVSMSESSHAKPDETR